MIIKPQLDDREYRHVCLPNGLGVLLISDPHTDKAAAALDVHVGHLCDPSDVAGLAHFCEHLLFMGTEKYPIENSYSQFLNEHGGHSNAFTAAENTNYYFDVQADALEPALDRFAQFFICPLFDNSCTERELNAVDSEHKKNLQMDNWRLYQLEKDLSSPLHPYNKFGTGNIETLKTIPLEKGIDIRKVLLDFHSKFYSANIMKLAILGKDSLDTLQARATEKFSAVRNKSIQVPCFPGHPLTANECGKLICVKPVKDIRLLELTFAFPDSKNHFHCQPTRIISHYIGHESEGSILSLLKKKGWAHGLSAGGNRGGINFDFFKIAIDLTEKGQEHYEEIILIVFQYIQRLKTEKVQQWVFDECATVASMAFQFKEKIPPSSYVSKLAGCMHEYPEDEVLSGPYLLKKYDPALIDEYIGYLSPDNFRAVLVSIDFDLTQACKAKYYGTEYEVQSFEHSLVSSLKNIRLTEPLHLPLENPFLPKDFAVERVETPAVAVYPRIVRQDDLIRLWYKKDDTFFVPKANLWLMFTSPEAYSTPLNTVLTHLFSNMLKDRMNEFSYYAELAGLNYSLEYSTEGLILQVEGFNDKIGKLLLEIVKTMKSFVVDADRFKVKKEQLARNYRNWKAESPQVHALYYVNYVVQEKLWHTDDKLNELQAFIPRLLSCLHVEGLVHGNVSREKAIEWSDQVLGLIKARPLHPLLVATTMRSHVLPVGHYVLSTPVANQENLNSAIEYLLYVGSCEDDLTRVLVTLLAQISSEPCFDQLRTKEQLGYIVYSGVRKQTSFLAFRVIIQSERHPMYLESRIEAFLVKLRESLAQMTSEEFKKHVSALITRLLEKNKSLLQESKKHWAHINSRYCDFSQNLRDAALLESIQKEQLVKFFDEHVNVDSVSRKKLSVHVVSGKCNEEGVGEDIRKKNVLLELKDVPLFKASLELSRAALPYDKMNYFKL